MVWKLHSQLHISEKRGIYSILTIPAGFSQNPAAQPKQSPLRDFLGTIANTEKLQY